MLSVEIIEHYKSKPPVNARKVVHSLLTGIPQKYLGGLKTVVLRDSTTLSHDRRREKVLSRKKKTLLRKAGGVYHHATKEEPAWIEIFVDNVINKYQARLSLKIPFLRDLIFADTVYHEIGHHIHRTKVPEYKETEDVAEKWEEKLKRYYFLRKYWYIIIPLFVVLWPFLKISRAIKKRSKKKRPPQK